MNDPYRILNVPRDADPATIKAAYRRLAKEFHPDRNPGDARAEQRFKDVGRAYDILSDPSKRVQFDRGQIDAEGNPRAGPGFAGFGFGQRAASGGDGMGFETFFERAFGGGRRAGGFAGSDAQSAFEEILRGHGRSAGRESRTRGRNTRHHLEVDFLTAARGGRQRVLLARGNPVEVDIPPGTRDGQTLRLKGKGRESAFGGEPGDALIEIAVRPHPLFSREGDDIHLELPVSLSEAVLGARIAVETIDGRVVLQIPAGSSSGRRLRLRGRGLAKSTGGRGDQYVRLMIVLPEPLGPELERWAREHSYRVRDEQGVA